MARAIRIEFPGALYHVTARGDRRETIFDDDRDREEFLRLVGDAVRRFGWIITTLTLMTNHFHIVLQTPSPNLAQGMQWLNSVYAAYYNRRHGKKGHLFGERYKAIHVQSEAYLQRLCRYVVLNPVAAKMVAAPEDYRWSTYRATAGLEPAPEWLSLEPLVPYFGEPATWRANYIAFVHEGIAKPDPIWRGLRRGIFLGAEDWLETMRQKIAPQLRKSDIPHDQRAAGRPPMRRIVNRLAAALNVHAIDIRRRGGDREIREIAAWLGVYEGRRRLRVIAQTLELRSQSRVTQLVKCCDRRMRRDPAFRKRVDELRAAIAA
ncbi:MAG: transposase [Thermoanaerobaculia bacterium]